MNYQKICISNRQLLTGSSDYNKAIHARILERIRVIAEMKLADAIILREKDLPADDYLHLAEDVYDICYVRNMPLILHHFPDAAYHLGLPLHLNMSDFLRLKNGDTNRLSMIGVSTHTVDEALKAEGLGASYITASHIFPTSCKPGLPPRGLDYLQEVCKNVNIPVFALGGIHMEHIASCLDAGADGVCMMSEYFGEHLRY